MILDQHFRQALERQAGRQNRQISPLNEAVAKMIFNAANKAIRDTRANPSNTSFKVVSAPTGSSKTNSALAFACAMYTYDPTFTCAFIVEEITQAEAIYQELAHEIPKVDLGVWTGYHDEKQYNPSDLAKYGFKPDLTTLAEVAEKRIAIFTHAKWLNEITSGKDFGVRYRWGKPRDVLFIDEQPSAIEVLQQTPSDILSLRDTIMSADKEHALVPILTSIVDRMEAVFRQPGDEMEAAQLVDFLNSYGTFSTEAALDFCREHTIGTAEHFLEGFKFLQACSLGYCFLARGRPYSFVAYLPTFKPSPNQVILDATADLSGLYPLLGAQLAEDVPTIDYSNLSIHHVQAPSEFKSIREVVKARSLAEAYAEWVWKVVMGNTKPKDRVLVVVHKDMVTTQGLFKHSPKEPDLIVFPGRISNVIWWGQGIGSNQYKHCTHVFMFSEFYQPRRVTVAKTLGAKGQRAEEASLSGVRKHLTGDFLSIQEGDLLRWFKQLASRGNVRNVDPNGCCGHMNLYTSMEFDRLIRNLDRLFPKAMPPRRILEYTQGGPQDKRRQALIDLLSTTNHPRLSFKVIEEETGISTCNLSKDLSSTKVAPVLINYGWTRATSKNLGLPGKGSWLVRNTELFIDIP